MELQEHGHYFLKRSPCIFAAINDAEITFTPTLALFLKDAFYKSYPIFSLRGINAMELAYLRITDEYNAGKIEMFYIDDLRGIPIARESISLWESQKEQFSPKVDLSGIPAFTGGNKLSSKDLWNRADLVNYGVYKRCL